MDCDSMPALLATLQEPNNESRKRAEAAFTQFATDSPIECARMLLACSKTEKSESIRALAAVLLRRFAKEDKGHWGNEAVLGWRQALWDALRAEKGQTASRLLCDAVAAEASSSSWPEVCRSAGESLCDDTNSETKKSLLLVRALAREGDATTLAAADALARAVARCCSRPELSRASVACATSLAVRAPHGIVIANELAPACLAACGGFLERGETEDAAACLDALVEVASEAPAFFSASSRQALVLGRAIASCRQLEIETRGRGLDLACAICAESSKVDANDIAEVVQVAFATAAEDTTGSDASWAREPCSRRPLLAEDDDDEPQAASLGDAAMRSMAASVPPEVVAPTLLKCVEYGANGGRFRRAALAGLTALSLGSPESLEPHLEAASALIFSALSDFQNAGPRETIEACRLAAALSVSLRHAAANHLALGLPAALAPVIFETRLASPRLCGAACATLALAATGDDEEDDYDEFEGGNADIAGSAAYATAIADALTEGGLSRALSAALFETTDVNARFAVLDAVAQIAVAAGSDFAQCYPRFVPAIASAASDVDAEFRARAILCAATCGTAVGADIFRIEGKIIFTALLKDAEATPTGSDRSASARDDEDEDIADSDLLFGTLMPAAVHLCGLFGTEDWFSSNLERLIRPILVAATATPEIVADREDALTSAFGVDQKGAARKEADGQYSLAVDDVRVTVDLRAMWAKQKAAEALGDIVDALDSAAPENLILSTADALAPLATFAGSSFVRANASLSLAQVAEAAVQKFRVDSTQKVMAATISRRAALACATGLDAETRPEARVDHCRGLANVLDHVLNASPGGYETNPSDVFASLFTDVDVQTMATSLLKHAVKSRERRDEEKEEEATNAEVDLQTQLVNALGCLSKLGRPSYAPIFDAVVAPFFLRLLHELEDDRYAGLCVLMDAVDRLPTAADKYGNQVLATALEVLANADDYEADFLATAAYAVAVVARRTPHVPQKQAIAALLQRLIDDEALSPRVIDNCVQALYELDSNTFLDTWLSKLPLTADLEEARRANKYLLHILENDPKQHQVIVVARLADALAEYDDSEFPEPPTTTMDKRTHDQLIRRLQALSQQS